MPRPRVVCLLPARNAAGDLPGFFASVGRFCDAIVALDDGSTDNTGDLLAANPLVKLLLTNPRRTDYRGWDDAANRNRLLRAAAALEPDWIISIDADERIDDGDAAALRAFLATDALPGLAYGFRCYPMQEDLAHYLPKAIWVYRLFAYEPGRVFPERALHFAPIPTSIPRGAFVQTTLRIQHLGGLTSAHRLARYEKYREADPDRAHWPDYTPLLRDPDPYAVLPWPSRPPDLPILLVQAELADIAADVSEIQAPLPDDTPALSIVVLADGPEDRVLAALSSAYAAAGTEPVEVLLVAHGASPIIEAARERHPDITVVELAAVGTRGAARNAGWRSARGRHVLFLNATLQALPGAVDGFLRAHRRGHALAAGLVDDGATSWVERTAYLLSVGSSGVGRRLGIVAGAPRQCSYARDVLADLGGFPENLDAGEEIVVNRLLSRRGYLADRDPAARLRYRDATASPRRVIASALRRGKAEGRFLLMVGQERGGIVDRRFVANRLIRHLPRRIERLRRATVDRRAVLLAAIGECAAWIGLLAEVCRPTAGKKHVLLGRTTGTFLVAGTRAGEATTFVLVRYDLVAGKVRCLIVPPALTVRRGDGRTSRLDNALGFGRGQQETTDDLSRFLVDDVVGRAFGVAIDDYVSLDLEAIGPERGSLFAAIETLGRWSALPRLISGLRRGAVRTSLPPLPLTIILNGLRSIDPASVVFASLPTAVAGESEDERRETVAAFAQAFLEPAGSSPMGIRDALKLVEWA